MNSDPTYFWTRYLEEYFNHNIPRRLSYSNNAVLSGFTIDLDLLVPCDPDTYIPSDINEDYRLAKIVADEFQDRFRKIMFYKNDYTRVQEEDLSYIILARDDIDVSKLSSCKKFVRYGFHIYFNKISASGEIKTYLAKDIKTNKL